MVKIYSSVQEVIGPICLMPIEILLMQHDLYQHFRQMHKDTSRLPFVEVKLEELKIKVDTSLRKLPVTELDLLLEGLCLYEATGEVLKGLKKYIR